MALTDIPLAPGRKHVAAFEHAGWRCARIKGAHHILEREGYDPHLSVPCHKGKDAKRALIADLIKASGMTVEEYCDHFYRRVPRVAA